MILNYHPIFRGSLLNRKQQNKTSYAIWKCDLVGSSKWFGDHSCRSDPQKPISSFRILITIQTNGSVIENVDWCVEILYKHFMDLRVSALNIFFSVYIFIPPLIPPKVTTILNSAPSSHSYSLATLQQPTRGTLHTLSFIFLSILFTTILHIFFFSLSTCVSNGLISKVMLRDIATKKMGMGLQPQSSK